MIDYHAGLSAQRAPSCRYSRTGTGTGTRTVRQAKPGQGGRSATETLRRSPAGGTRPVKPSQQPEASLARVLGRPRPRSVDSERVGRAIEPRKCSERWGRSARTRCGSTEVPDNGEARRPGRGLRAWHASDGLPRNLGGLCGCGYPLAKRERRSKRVAMAA